MVVFSREFGAPGEVWTICRWHDAPHGTSALSFDDELAAVAWLRGFPASELRRLAFLLVEAEPIHRLTDATLSELLGTMLLAGELRALAGRAQHTTRLGGEPSVEERLIRRLPVTSRTFHFEGERWRIVDALRWSTLRDLEDERFEVVRRPQAEAVLARLQRWSGLSLDEAQAVSAVPALLPAVWYSSQPTVGLLLVRIVERTWNMAPAGLVEAVTPSQLGGKAKDVIDHWIRIELVDTDNQPVSGEAYKVALPDGVIREGRLDDQGRAMIGGIRVGGPCKVCFPQIDGQEWRAL